MGIDYLTYRGERYPKFQSIGNAARFAIPYAQQVCTGHGYDIGCMKKQWAFPGAVPIDLSFDDQWHATNLPDTVPDYIFSSHCLEHIDDWVSAMDYWYSRLNVGGVLFLYLPDYSQKYWRPWHNRKHRHIFSPQIIRDYLDDRGYHNIFVGERDLNNSFMAMAEK